jgi:energy-coupling factor transporter ATP-binding protein EcfA2
MIEFHNFSFQYPRSENPVLREVNLRLEPGCLTLVAGPSGSGKSTLLRCLNGLVPHFTGGQLSGSIDVFGEDPVEVTPSGIADKVGFVFQEPESQFVFDIVEDEIAFALENQGMPRQEMKARLDRIFEQMGLEKFRHRAFASLSGGEKQKVAIASALVLQPKVLVLDEPTSQLDPAGAETILAYIVSLKDQLDLTVVIAEHRLERLLLHTDRMILLAGDGNVTDGTPQEVLSEMSNVPPIVQIGRNLDLSPLPIVPEEFPDFEVLQSKAVKAHPKGMVEPSSLRIENLAVQYNDHPILKGVSLTLRKGEILTLMGLNGAGKTTLLRAILGLVPSTGKRVISDQALNAEDLRDIVHTIAYLPQNPNDLLFADSVLEEMRVTLNNHNRPVDAESIEAHLAQFKLADKRDRYPRDLSVGERQRTALAAITIHDPPIILLDEPTRGMDYENKALLREILKSWRSKGKSILVVTHDVEFAAQLADRVAILEDGNLIFQGAPEEAFTQFPPYRTQTAKIFPSTGWYRPQDFDPSRIFLP